MLVPVYFPAHQSLFKKGVTLKGKNSLSAYQNKFDKTVFIIGLFVTPALAGRLRCASFRPFVRRLSVRQDLPFGSCERNSSYSFVPIVLKLCMYFLHGMRLCMWFGYNCKITFSTL